MIAIKRIYEEPGANDGARILVDRLWPRGLSKDAARIDAWLKDVAPSDALRRWYQHDPSKWSTFRRRYFKELADNPDVLGPLLELVAKGQVTLLFAAKETKLNNAAALKEYIESR